MAVFKHGPGQVKNFFGNFGKKHHASRLKTQTSLTKTAAAQRLKIAQPPLKNRALKFLRV